MTAASPDVFLIGAGVSGLSTAIVLLDAGLSVQVYAADPPHRTTSAAAGALWGPHLVGCDERIGPWAAQTLHRFGDLAAEPAAGVTHMAGLVASPAEAEPEPPAFTAGAGPATACSPDDLPAGFSTGWRYAAPVVDMPAHLDYLLTQVLGKGGRVQLGPSLRSLAEVRAASPAPVVVNCAGIGARDLVPDDGLTPVRGQVVVAANPGLTEFFVGEARGSGRGDLHLPARPDRGTRRNAAARRGEPAPRPGHGGSDHGALRGGRTAPGGRARARAPGRPAAGAGTRFALRCRRSAAAAISSITTAMAEPE